MKRINPMYMALLLVAALAVVIVKLEQAKKTQDEVRAELMKTEIMAQRVATLREQWDEPTRRAAEIERLLRSNILRDAGITRKKTKGAIVLDAESIDRQTVEYLVNKLMNDSFTIKTMTLKRLDDTEASMHLEVAL